MDYNYNTDAIIREVNYSIECFKEYKSKLNSAEYKKALHDKDIQAVKTFVEKYNIIESDLQKVLPFLRDFTDINFDEVYGI